MFSVKKGADGSWAVTLDRRMSVCPRLDNGDGVGRLLLSLTPLLLSFLDCSPHPTTVSETHMPCENFLLSLSLFHLQCI